jgi:hypothetical protein
MPSRRFLRCLAAATALAACGSDPAPPPLGGSYSFESDLEGWTPDGTDLELAGGEIAWSIVQTNDLAFDGPGSARLFLDNMNDAGKIWLERAFDVVPGGSYRAELALELATADWGGLNRFTIVAGIAATSPETRDDLTYQGDTWNGADADVGWVWMHKAYAFDVTAGPDGRLHAFVGIWGTWEGPRTYFVDRLRIALTPR